MEIFEFNKFDRLPSDLQRKIWHHKFDEVISTIVLYKEISFTDCNGEHILQVIDTLLRPINLVLWPVSWVLYVKKSSLTPTQLLLYPKDEFYYPAKVLFNTIELLDEMVIFSLLHDIKTQKSSYMWVINESYTYRKYLPPTLGLTFKIPNLEINMTCSRSTNYCIID